MRLVHYYDVSEAGKSRNKMSRHVLFVGNDPTGKKGGRGGRPKDAVAIAVGVAADYLEKRHDIPDALLIQMHSVLGRRINHRDIDRWKKRGEINELRLRFWIARGELEVQS